MEATDALASRVQAAHVRGVRLRVDDDPAHAVVGGRRDLHRLAADVQHLPLDELAVHPRQLVDDVRLATVADVEEHAAVGPATTFGDLRVVRQRHAIP